MLNVPALSQTPPPLPPLNDPPEQEILAGKFVWFDLATPNLGAQQAFYQDLFGWSYRSPGPSADEYVLALNGNSPVAGMFRSEPESGEQDGAVWLSLMSVSNVDDAIASAKTAGGTLELGPAMVPDRGQHALLKDPSGAIFGVIRSSSGDPTDGEIPVGGIFWVDLFSRDIDAMAKFYASLAPYEVSERQIGEGTEGRILSAAGMPRAGVVPVDEEANRASWVPYVRVEDVQSVLDKVVEGGGFVIVAPDPAILDGNLGIFVDPHGGVTGVLEWTYGEEGS